MYIIERYSIYDWAHQNDKCVFEVVVHTSNKWWAKVRFFFTWCGSLDHVRLIHTDDSGKYLILRIK